MHADQSEFDFHIVNFPDLSGNNPTVPAYGTYISLLIRYSRACHNCDNFPSRYSMLAGRLFNRAFFLLSTRKLIRTFYKFMDRYRELASKFNKSPLSMICDGVSMAQQYHTFHQLMVIGAVCCAQDRAYLLPRHLMPPLINISLCTYDQQ